MIALTMIDLTMQPRTLPKTRHCYARMSRVIRTHLRVLSRGIKIECGPSPWASCAILRTPQTLCRMPT